MIYNAQRQHVFDWRDGEPSTCPDCGGRLIGKRGDVIRWHWAHHHTPPGGGPGGCGQESDWHLQMKSLHDGPNGWTVEEPFWEEGQVLFRIDAVRRPGGIIREFVHSLSPCYLPKHDRLMACNANILWLFDGEGLRSERWHYRQDRKGRRFIRNLLKPKARDYCERLGGLVHFRGRIWRQWMQNNYFEADPRDHRQISDLLVVMADYLRAEAEVEEQRIIDEPQVEARRRQVANEEHRRWRATLNADPSRPV